MVIPEAGDVFVTGEAPGLTGDAAGVAGNDDPGDTSAGDAEDCSGDDSDDASAVGIGGSDSGEPGALSAWLPVNGELGRELPGVAAGGLVGVAGETD